MTGVPQKHSPVLASSSRRRTRRINTATSPAAPGVVEFLEPRICLTGSGGTEFVNLAVTDDAAIQQQPTIAVNPLNSDHIVIVYRDASLTAAEGQTGIGVSVSFDAGETFARGSIDLPAGFDDASTAPVVDFTADGHVFVIFQATGLNGHDLDIVPVRGGNTYTVTTDHFETNNGIFVASSLDGGLSWSGVSPLSAHVFADSPVPFDAQPDLAIDTFEFRSDGSLNPHFGNIYATWITYFPAGQYPLRPDFAGGGAPLVAVSRDDGATWEPLTRTTFFPVDVNMNGVFEPEEFFPIEVPALFEDLGFFVDAGTAASFGGSPRLTVGPDGDLYVGSFSGGTFVVFHSPDGGATVLQPARDTSTRVVFGNSFFARSGFPQFETQPNPGLVRSIVADPTQPGRLYAVESLFIADAASNSLDLADIFVATSDDHGATWDFTFTGNGTLLGQNIPINDDNGGQSVTREQADPIIAVQSRPELSVDESGHVALIWYDTRRGLNDSFHDIFGTASLNAGADFSPNFRVTTESSPLLPEALPGEPEFIPADELGARLGFTTADGFGYAAWTDFRNGNPDIFFSRFALDPVPSGLNDRFEQNDTPATATDLGVIVQENIPRLTLVPGEEDWFSLTTGAIGDVRVNVTIDEDQLLDASQADQFVLELYDADGTTLLTMGEPVAGSDGRLTGWQLSHPATAGAQFHARLASLADPTERDLNYSLLAEALTADFGSRAEVDTTDTLQPGEFATYRLVTPAAGSVQATILATEPDQSLEISLVDAESLEPLADAANTLDGNGTAIVSARTFEQSEILITVEHRGDSPTEFLLELINLDQSATQGGRIAALPIGGASPSIGDFNNDGNPDLLAAILIDNTIAVLPGNGDGTFQAPRRFTTGANLGTFGSAQEAQAADLNGDGNQDIITPNTAAAGVSVLLGRGDGTFDAQRRFDAQDRISEVEIVDVDGDGFLDLLTANVNPDVPGSVAFLRGRGDGSFEPQIVLPTAVNGGSKQVYLADFNNDGHGDIYLQPENITSIEIQQGFGDGTFGPSMTINTPGVGNGGRPFDVDGDGNLDILVGVFTSDVVFVLFGNGDFTFREPEIFPAGGLAVRPEAVDIGSRAIDEDGNVVLGDPDGVIDLVAPLALMGETGVSVLPGIADEDGNFETFGDPIFIPGPDDATEVVVTDLDLDGQQDIVVGDFDGLTIVFGNEPERQQNTTQETARNLGFVAHHQEPTRTITTETTDAWFRLQAPIEAVAEAGDEVLDFAAFFAAEDDTGLNMEVLDGMGNVLATGDRFRLIVPQGQELFVHIFGNENLDGSRGTGAFSLNINALPQLVSVSAEPLLPGVGAQPGGRTGLLVLTFQGDRLDQDLAEAPSHYNVTFLGADGVFGTADDRVIPLGDDDPSRQPVVANPSSNVDVSSGQTFATAVRQTVTLAFDEALPAGSYRIEISPEIQTRPFNATEAGLLEADTRFGGHPVVSLDNGEIVEGIAVDVANLVQPTGRLGDFQAFEGGTAFLTQLQNDLSILLDNLLTEFGDVEEITPTILNQITSRFRVAIGDLNDRVTSMLIVFLDPVSLDLVDPGQRRVTFNLQTNEVQRTIPNAFVEVGGNVEVVVVPNVNGRFRLNVADVPPTARGGVVFLGQQREMVQTITSNLRSGQQTFELDLRESQAVPPPNQLAAVDGPAISNAAATRISQLLITQVLARLAAGNNEFGSNSQQEPDSSVSFPPVDEPEIYAPPPGRRSLPERIWDGIVDALGPLLEDPDDDNPMRVDEGEKTDITPAELLRQILERVTSPPQPDATDSEFPDTQDSPDQADEVDRSSSSRNDAGAGDSSSSWFGRFRHGWLGSNDSEPPVFQQLGARCARPQPPGDSNLELLNSTSQFVGDEAAVEVSGSKSKGADVSHLAVTGVALGLALQRLDGEVRRRKRMTM